MRGILAIVTGALTLLGSGGAQAALLAGFTDGAVSGVATFTNSLGFVSQDTLPGPISGVAAGVGGTFYTSSGNTTREYNAAGTQIASITGSSTTQTPALDFANGVVYAAVTDGSFFAVATFNSSLGFLNQVAVAGPISGLAAGNAGTFYTSSGNATREYDSAGTLLATITGSATTQTPALDFANGIVYAAVTDGSFFGVAEFTSSLQFITQIALDGPIAGIAAGDGGTFYTTSGNLIREYSASGTLLNTETGSATTHGTALSFVADPAVTTTVLEPETLALLVLGAAAATVRRKRR